MEQNKKEKLLKEIADIELEQGHIKKLLAENNMQNCVSEMGLTAIPVSRICMALTGEPLDLFNRTLLCFSMKAK